MNEGALLHLEVETPIGALDLCATAAGLIGLTWPGASGRPAAARPGSGYPVLERARAQLAEYFAGRRTEFDLMLASAGTEFQRAVWRELESIPCGETRTYGALAARLRRPRAARAVGAASAQNPFPIIVPCHRLIGAGGALTGYGGGIERKRWLLAHERKVAAAGGRPSSRRKSAVDWPSRPGHGWVSSLEPRR